MVSDILSLPRKYEKPSTHSITSTHILRTLWVWYVLMFESAVCELL